MSALLVLSACVTACATGAPALLTELDRYNVVWTTPSHDSSGSMPLGGGDIGANVWVENGDLLFYAQQSAAFDKNGEYLKLGRFRLRLDPNPLAGGGTFRQELNVREGAITISGETAAAGLVSIKLWVEVRRPVIHVEVASAQPMALTATYESWRHHDVDLLPEERPATGRRSSLFDYDGYQVTVVKKGDTIEPGPNGIFWYHDVGREPNAFDLSLQVEELTALKGQMWDPLVNRISGGTMRGDNLAFAGTSDGTYVDTPYRAWHFKSRAPAQSHHVDITALVEQPTTPVAWKAKLEAIAAPADGAKLWQENLNWWVAFWDRAYILINPGKGEADNGWRVGRNYQLFRQQVGGQTLGQAPVKFNGGNLTFDAKFVNPAYNFGPDYRRWGGWSYTAANQELVYWGYLMNGDFEGMLPQFDVYRHGLINAVARTRAHWGHDGASFAEQFQHSGMPVASHYGFVENGFAFFIRPRDFEKGEMVNPWIGQLYAGQLDFAAMILEYQRYSGRDITPYVPFLLACLQFYDQHYQQIYRKNTGQPLDEHGHLVIFPSTPSEHHLNSTNPSDAVSGLTTVARALRALPPGILSAADAAYVDGFATRLPPLPTYTETIDGREHTFFAASAKDGGDDSSRSPGLWALWPFGLEHFGSAHFDWMADTWDYKTPEERKSGYIGWERGVIFWALLGRTSEAKAVIAQKLDDAARLPVSDMSKPNRFPTFWGPGYDWGPDHNWGGGAMIGLQNMLLQTGGDSLYLLPAWPKDWDVTFKLHAPRSTTVEGRFAGGKLIELKVTPRSREKDVIYFGER